MNSSNILASLLQAFAANDESLPWGTLRYLIGEAMYGGRVSDSLDRRVLTTYLDEYLGDFLFDSFQPFYFYKTDTVEYRCNQRTQLFCHLLSHLSVPFSLMLHSA